MKDLIKSFKNMNDGSKFVIMLAFLVVILGIGAYINAKYTVIIAITLVLLAIITFLMCIFLAFLKFAIEDWSDEYRRLKNLKEENATTYLRGSH